MKKAFIITVSILSVAIVVLSVLLYTTHNSLNSTSMNLENLYQRSFYDLVNNVNNMEVEVSKLLVTSDATSQQKSLSKLKQQTSDAENDLSFLPINMNVLEKTTRFMNQFNGYCTTLISYNNGTIENKDYETLSKAYESIATIKEELNEIMWKIMSGYKISDNLDGGSEKADFSLNFSGLSNDTIEYPSLIYDGPFSDSTISREIKGLPQEEIDEKQAENRINEIFGDRISNLTYLGNSEGKFQTFDFGMNTTDGRNYFVQITKRGGFLLTLNSNVLLSVDQSTPEALQSNLAQATENNNNINANNGATKEESEVVKSDSVNKVTDKTKLAIDSALTFAKKLNLNNMQCVWSASSQEICYVNLAPVVDEITMYPDLIKVKVDLSNNAVIGFEASSYAYNHIERDDLIPQLSEEEAKKLVSQNLEIDNIRLCVIPLDYVGETLAYEFEGKHNNFTYYLYLDATTGKQVRVLRIVQTQDGDLIL